MKYIHPPLYKYFAYFIIIYMFFKHQRELPIDKLINNAFIITIIMITLDYLFINNHPTITENQNLKLNNEINDNELENIEIE